MLWCAIFEAYAYHKDIWVPVTDYYMYFHLIVLSSLTARPHLRTLHIRNFKITN